jgi:hypothetical protein
MSPKPILWVLGIALRCIGAEKVKEKCAMTKMKIERPFCFVKENSV